MSKHGTEGGVRKFLRYLGRAMLLRCPVCGKTPIFTPVARTRRLRDWFTPLDGPDRLGPAIGRFDAARTLTLLTPR